MTPEPEAGFADACARACPGFRAVGRTRFARKTVFQWGEVDGRPVIAKRLRRPDAVWAWYLDREIALYRAFALRPLPIRAPAFVAAADDLLVIERLPGAVLATRRHPHADLDPAVVERLVAYREALAAWQGDVPTAPPPVAVRVQLRLRLLEDPTAPVAWVREGLATCVAQRLLEADVARRLDDAIAAHLPIAFGHGDLLLRNIIFDGDQLGLVDWECAGPHLHDWDLALLWSQLAPSAREPIERVVRAEPARWRAFLGLVGFALARELRFLVAFHVKAGHAKHRSLRDELAEVAAQL